MNRRNFFSLITGAIGGVVYAFNKSKECTGFEKTTFVLSKTYSVSASRSGHPSTEPSSSISSSCCDCPNGGDCENCSVHEPKKRSGTELAMEFDEPIVDVCEFQGRMIVACEHSVWEIFEDYEGVFKRKLMYYT